VGTKRHACYNNQTPGNDNGTISAGTYVSGSTGNEFADLLVGKIAGYSQTSANTMAHLVNKRFDFLGEDTWKATSRLTITMVRDSTTSPGGTAKTEGSRSSTPLLTIRTLHFRRTPASRRTRPILRFPSQEPNRSASNLPLLPSLPMTSAAPERPSFVAALGRTITSIRERMRSPLLALHRL
jgi:hypothetical protein